MTHPEDVPCTDGTDHGGKIEECDGGLDLLRREERVEACAEIWRVVKGDAHEDMVAVENTLKRVYGEEIAEEGFERELEAARSVHTGVEQ